MNASFDEKEERTYSALMFYIFMILLITCGTIETLVIKVMNNTESLGRNFTHIWFILFIQGFGELLFLPVFLLIKRKVKIGLVDHDLHHNYEDYILENYRKCDLSDHELSNNIDFNINTSGGDIISKLPSIKTEGKEEISPLTLALPGVCDLISNILTNFALRLLPGSVYSIFSISTIFFTKLFSVAFLKNKFYRHHFLGLLVIVLGLTLIAIVSTNQNSHISSQSEVLWGIILTLLGQIFTAIQFTLEELFMKKYECHPLRAVGWEGFWVTSIMLILIFVFQHIPCVKPEQGVKTIVSHICSLNDEGQYLLEDTIFALRQIETSTILIICTFLLMFAYSTSIFSGIFFSVYSTSAARAVVDGIRPFFVWLFFMMPFNLPQHREHFLFLQLIGFMFVILGNLIYNEVIVVKYCNFHYNTREQIKKRIEENTHNIKEIFLREPRNTE